MAVSKDGVGKMLEGFETLDIVPATNVKVMVGGKLKAGALAKTKSQKKVDKRVIASLPQGLSPKNTTVRKIIRWQSAILGTRIAFASAGVTEANGVVYWTLQNVGEYSDLTAGYQLWRFNSIKAHYFPAYNQYYASNGSSSNPTLPRIRIAADYDGKSSTTWEDVGSYQTCKEHVASEPFVFKVTPCYDSAVYAGSTSAWGYAAGRGWLDFSAQGAQWYGLVWAVNTMVASSYAASVGCIDYEFEIDLAAFF